MTAVYELGAAAVVLGWCLSRLLGLAIAPARATVLGYGLAAGIVLISYSSFLTGMFTALLAPYGVLLPALALQNTARRMGIHTKPYSSAEMVAAFGLYLLFLMASAGVFEWDPYSYGYGGQGAVMVAILLAGYALWRGHIVLLAVIVVAQALWLLDIGSSNLFDHLSHVLLVFILPITLLRCATQKPQPNPDGENRQPG
jgi:hypothetical protein